MGVYLDYTEYISGTSQDGALTNTEYAFTFKEVYNVNEKGAVTGRSNNVTISGKTKVVLSGLSIKSVTLTPGGQTTEKYIYNKI